VEGASLATLYTNGHNTFRKQYGLKAIEWSDGLARKAYEYAQNCVFEHLGKGDGENIALGYWYSAEEAAVESVKLFATEKKSWNCAANTCKGTTDNLACGHYLQMIWEGTKQVGCASAPCWDKTGQQQMVVCFYNPSGNVVENGKFKRPFKGSC